MKGVKLLFTMCLAMLCFCGVHADDAGDTVRAATRRGTTGVVATNNSTTSTTASQSTRGKAANTNTTASQSAINSRATAASATTAVRERNTNISPRDTATSGANITSRESTTTSRAGAAVQSRATSANATASSSRGTNTAPVVSRSAAATSRTAVSRTATAPQTATGRTPASRAAIPSRIATSSKSRNTRAATSTAAGARISRAAALTREDIMNRKYSTCKDVYYECMDEFCANKDAQLKRCSCSSRVNEFDTVKKQLANVEEKMLDFSQRLLTVNMDKEDAAALNVATEGENAFYNNKDTSASKKLLDEIAKKLNTSFDSSTFDTGANALSWSLNIDAAFDSVDSLMGASTTTKTGTALYSAATPICHEMALEVCSEDELAIAESGYMVAIEQDCNTVYKAYETQVDQAREKVREGGALLDISRLDIYQKRNSDDILTCKRKMLDMLYDTTVCGAGLGKCLDTSGRYIDPSTGSAFLTVDLVNLGKLITRPTGDQTWTSAPGNQAFVTYLYSKKKFLEPAMENCQDIADTVWDAFIEDALGQIKLAQESKLEDMRQSCTTLTTQCLTNTSESLADFDARALSIFGVQADKTVNAMCAEVTNACTALLESSGGGTDWVGGITEIATDTTYDTILQTCREVGRACIIQECRSISGNFGLCEPMNTSNNRKSIINRTSCWDEVVDCVASAGVDKVDSIMARRQELGDLSMTNQTFYDMLYGPGYEITNGENDVSTRGDAYNYSCYTSEDGNCVYDICQDECGCTIGDDYTCYATDTSRCHICRIAERIWGNCETAPDLSLMAEGAHNKIKEPIDTTTSTLLYWLAVNTGTDTRSDSCRSTLCPSGFYPVGNTCVNMNGVPDDCDTGCTDEQWQINIGDNKTNCCATNGGKVKLGNNICCMNGANNNMCKLSASGDIVKDINLTGVNAVYGAGSNYKLICAGGTVTQSGNTVTCQGGHFVIYNPGDTHYYNPCYGNDLESCEYGTYIKNYVEIGVKAMCLSNPPTTYIGEFDGNANKWLWKSAGDNTPYSGNITGWKVSYSD